MPAYHLSCLALPVMFTVLTASLLRPDLALRLWLSFTDLLERRKARRLTRMSRLIEDKMKKYWVIDMRKLR